MGDKLEKLVIDLINFNQKDERNNENIQKDRFMILCFKIFIISLLVTIIALFIHKYIC